MPDGLPLVSVGMPTYNRAARLRLALASVLGQTYSNLEVIVSDNASTDDTWAVCRDVASKDSRVQVYRQPANVGPVANFEFARNKASGKYFMWLADDDLLSENYVGCCVEQLERDPDIALVYGAASYLLANGTTRHEALFSLDQVSPILRVLTYFRRVSENAMFYGVYRRDAIADCRMPNALGGDWAWVADVAVNGRAAVQPDAKIRRSAAGASSSYQRIMEAIDSPRWMRRMPSLALALGLGAHVALKSPSFRARYPLRRFVVGPMVAAILCHRLIVKRTLQRWLSAIRR